jgi:hypothetical protein
MTIQAGGRKPTADLAAYEDALPMLLHGVSHVVIDRQMGVGSRKSGGTRIVVHREG